jgi:TP901-1 family phage major tail protein
MAATVGRAVTFLWGDDSPQEEIPGVREKGIELSGEAIDITSDDSDGWRELLSVPAQNEVNISISGVTKNTTLEADWFAGTRTQAATIEYRTPTGTLIASITGTFYLATYTNTGNYNDAVTFEAELQSTGVVSFTPGP